MAEVGDRVELVSTKGRVASAFRIDSDEGRDVVLEVMPALLDAETPFEVVGIRGDDPPRMRFRLSNDEAGELLALLDGQIGDWFRERAIAAATFARGPRFDVEDLDDVSDPDHPRHAEVLADNADWSRKAERENG